MKERLLSIHGIGEARAEQILRDYPTVQALAYALGKGEIEDKYPASIVDGLLLEFLPIEEAETEAATPSTADPARDDSSAAPPSPVVRLRSTRHYFRIPYLAAEGERLVDFIPGKWTEVPQEAVDTPYCQDLLRQGYLIKEE
jgi:hypothetical protein